ncbi:MAG TPA: ASCH domain-containing protein [Roseiflexaceae bacterium]|nr:ASCH domain-containing protein [Roseiflexaceae bacterium]
MRTHLAIMVEPYLTRVLAGEKTIESRFSRSRIPPYGCVAAGDLIWLKRAGGPVLASARASEVRQYSGLSGKQVDALLARWGPELNLEADFAARARECRYATLIWLGEIVLLPEPQAYRRRGRQGWVHDTDFPRII